MLNPSPNPPRPNPTQIGVPQAGPGPKARAPRRAPQGVLLQVGLLPYWTLLDPIRGAGVMGRVRSFRRLGFIKLSPIRTLRKGFHNRNTQRLSFLYIGVHMRSFDTSFHEVKLATRICESLLLLKTPLDDHGGDLLLLHIITRGGEDAHAFVQGAGAHGRRSQGTSRRFFSDLLQGLCFSSKISSFLHGKTL